MIFDDQIQQEAAHWFTVQRRGPMSLDERLAFDAWRRDPLHQAALNRMHEVWGELSFLAGTGTAPRRPRLRRREAIAAVLIVGVSVGLGAGSWWMRGRDTTTTGVGEQRTQELPDGSVVALNVMTRARYDLDGDQRVVRLTEGEATFVVQKDPERPFLVRAGGYEVRAIGTAFNVRSRDQRLDVAVKEGVVQVRRLAGGPQPLLLRAGQRLRIDDTVASPQGPLKASAISTAAVDEWRKRVLTYENATVVEVLRDLNRYYERPVTADPEVSARRITLRLVVDDRAETLNRLSVLLRARVKRSDREDRLTPAA